MKNIFIYLIKFFLLFSLGFFSCISDEYDLKNSQLITEITIGGDSLSFPIGKTKPIFLGSFMDSVDNIVKSADGKYLFEYHYSLKKELQVFKPISITVPKVQINPINTNVVDIKLPELSIKPVILESTVSIPKVDAGAIVMPKINTVFTKQLTIQAPSVPFTPANAPQRAKQLEIPVGPYQISATDKFDVSSQMIFPTELKKVNLILLKNNTVYLKIDKSEINKLGFSTQNDIIKSFRIDFPAEFQLSNNIGVGSRIQGSSFVIENAQLTASVNVYEASFKIERMNFSSIPQLGMLSYNSSVPYSFLYEFNGSIDVANNVVGKSLMLGFSITSTPEVADMEIVTNDFALPLQQGSYQINQVIDNFPSEIHDIKTINFETGAALQLSIADPKITPFVFKMGNCMVSLPKTFIFNAYQGLDPNTNILTIPFNQLFGTKSIGISGLKIDKNIIDKKLNFTDNFTYSINNLTVASTQIMLNELQNTGDKKTIISAEMIGLKIKDAALTTNKITFEVPEQTTRIEFNELISKEIQKIYSINLLKPANIDFKILIKNLPPGIDSIFFENYIITLPSFMKFAAGNVNNRNEIVLNRGFNVNEGFFKKLSLLGLDFGNEGYLLKDGYVNFNEIITLMGKAYVKSTDLNLNQIKPIQILQSVDVDPLIISTVVAQLALVIDPITQVIPFNLGVLSNGDNNYDIDNPMFKIEIGNSFAIPVNLDMSIVPKQKGVVLTNSIIKASLPIAATDTIGKLKWSKFWINKTGQGFSQGYTPIAIPALASLLASSPDEIEFKVIPSITGEKQLIDLNSTLNELQLNASVIVPINFGKDFKINVKDTIDDLSDELSEFLKLNLIQGVDIVAIVDNGIPLNFNLDFVPLDKNKNKVPGIEVTSGATIKSCNIDGTTQKSIISLGLKETTVGALKLLDGFDFKIGASANSTVAGISLNSKQSITIELRVRIPKGISLNKK